jgi:hypothetical protein
MKSVEKFNHSRAALANLSIADAEAQVKELTQTVAKFSMAYERCAELDLLDMETTAKVSYLNGSQFHHYTIVSFGFICSKYFE